MNWSNTKPNPSPGRISPLNFPPNGSPKWVPQMGPPNGYPFGVPIWGTPAPPSEIDDFPGVPLLGPPGSASDFKGAGTPHGESNVEL